MNAVYRARTLKRRRRTKAELDQLDEQIYEVLYDDKPQSVRHIFYRMTDPRLPYSCRRSTRARTTAIAAFRIAADVAARRRHSVLVDLRHEQDGLPHGNLRERERVSPHRGRAIPGKSVEEPSRVVLLRGVGRVALARGHAGRSVPRARGQPGWRLHVRVIRVFRGRGPQRAGLDQGVLYRRLRPGWLLIDGRSSASCAHI